MHFIATFITVNFYVVNVQIGHISYNFLGNSSKRYLHSRHRQLSVEISKFG